MSLPVYRLRQLQERLGTGLLIVRNRGRWEIREEALLADLLRLLKDVLAGAGAAETLPTSEHTPASSEVAPRRGRKRKSQL